MNDSSQLPEMAANTATQPARRRLLIGLLSAYTATLVPWAIAQPVDNDEEGTFFALSAILAGRKSLDTNMGKRLYEALVQNDPAFPKAARAVLAIINERKLDPLQIQKTLDEEKSSVAHIPRQIATAWFLGTVGSGHKARALAYEHALNAQIVSDVLNPPTYSYGEYGSWTKKPI